jgi:valyl-tRNA synthetase
MPRNDPALPKPSLDGLEDKWAAHWEAAGTYRFDRSHSRAAIFAIDTPPLTASGSLHVGHAFSFTHTDIVARFQRMSGREVFYPIGWDDNGLASERRVQNYFHVRCDPTQPYQPDLGFLPPADAQSRKQPPRRLSRRNFIEHCQHLVAADEQAYEDVWRRIGLSVDWTTAYTTIGERAQRASQRMFLRNLAAGQAYTALAPTAWDVDFHTAVAQAEQVDREQASAFHALAFTGPDGETIAIETTRPELLPACVALVAHPDDERYRHLFGAHALTPLFGARIPILAHRLASPDKGSGIAMVCTFGDATDVIWQRELKLPIRPIIGRDGRLTALDTGFMTAPDADERYSKVRGQTTKQARAMIVAMLRDAGVLVGEPRPTTQAVKFYENGDRPLEIVTSRQWFIRTVEHRETLIAQGRALHWQPEFMRARYEDWVNGLTGDWLISRQRYFGVPFPVWYPLTADGEPDYDRPIVPDEASLPIDPQESCPPGYDESQRGQPAGFIGDPDVMDTWATSSITPQLAGGWCDDDDLFARVYPMDLRPQAHDIIRTWLFDTVLRGYQLDGGLPWSHAAISGWILDPDRKKMSKSMGNVVTPMALLREHGSDAVRYWAASGRPGVDTAFDTNQMRVGRRLATKLLNASRFVLGVPAPAPGATATEPLDLAMLATLAGMVDAATEALRRLDYTTALHHVEEFFWTFCDDYVELVKQRAYADGPRAQSARSALRQALSTLQRLFAPFLPFVTEEAWSWWQEGSIHRQPWPPANRTSDGPEASAALTAASAALAAARKAKASSGQSMRTEVDVLDLTLDLAPAERAAIDLVLSDVRAAANAREIKVR